MIENRSFCDSGYGFGSNKIYIDIQGIFAVTEIVRIYLLYKVKAEVITAYTP
jgi:hypothetical protein